MAKHRIEQIGECPDCKATGLYVGMAERDGLAVVCHTCKGTGKMTFVTVWVDFEGRRPRDDIHTVVRVNPGICLGSNLNFGGMPYSDWISGKPFPPGSEDRDHTCPAWFYQSADYNKKPEWNECIRIGSFPQCDSFGCKASCWTRWDKEHPAESVG